MKKLLIIVLLIFNITNAEQFKDPYQDIEYFVLENGLQVYLLSNEKATNTKIVMKVNVGWDIETNENYGLSHLVEHMIFRDSRVPYRDYLDYMKEEGASYVNGFTSRYDTEYITKIDSKKSYWLTALFAQMIFDKDVSAKDIEIEKGAVQVEIGEISWYDRIVSTLMKLKYIFPPNESIYETHFGLKKPKDLPDYHTEKVNNKKFTLEEVMSHYNTYYYPSNMILKVSGNFDIQKMKQLIIDKYSPITKTGTLRTYRPKRDATLSNKKYTKYLQGVGQNSGYIGTQYLFDDCEKHIILNAFIKYVATKIQQKLRNKDGKSYTVSDYTLQSRGAGVVAVSFDGLHYDFDHNINVVKETIKYYVENIDDNMIQDALNEYEKRYSTIEFDTDSLSSLIDKSEHMRSDHNIEEKTHYQFFSGITPQRFKEVITHAFVPENEYYVIYRDYYLFTGDSGVVSILILLMISYLYFTFSHWILLYRGNNYRKREVILSQRISNRFTGFIVLIILYMITNLFFAWFEYFSMKYIMGDSNYLNTLTLPYSIYVILLLMIVYLSIFFLVYRWIIRYYFRIDVTYKNIYILGSNPIVISKSAFKRMEVVEWTLKHFFQTKGWMLRFWKPLLRIETKNEIYYIRSSNAKVLKDDILSRWVKVE